MSDAVLFEARDDGIALITLNRPETRNALTLEIRDGLFAAWERFERDPALRVAILTGAAGSRIFPRSATRSTTRFATARGLMATTRTSASSKQ